MNFKRSVVVLMALLTMLGCKKEELELQSPELDLSLADFREEDAAAAGNSRCDALPDAARAELLQLCDINTLGGLDDVLHRLQSISKLFIDLQDNRGLFPLVYVYTTERTADAYNANVFEDREKAADLAVAFAVRYFKNLHAHLSGGQVEYHWKRYYQIAGNCNMPPLRIATGGINAHLTVDLPLAIMDINGRASFRDDYFIFGEQLVVAAEDIAKGLQDYYNVDAADFFGGLFLGEWLDAAVQQEGFTTELMFTTIRLESWAASQLLQTPGKLQCTRNAIRLSWLNKEKALDLLRSLRLLDN